MMVGKAGEQGRDRLDSTYYLDTRIYECSYDSQKEQQGVKDAVALILRAYDKDMPHYTGGFCSSNLLRVDNPIESKKLTSLILQVLQQILYIRQRQIFVSQRLR